MDRSERGRGRGRGYAGGSGLSSKTFEVSSDGSTFVFPNPLTFEDASLLKEFRSGLKCLGGYSEDEEQNFWNDNSCLTFFNTEFLPKAPSMEMKVTMDLNEAVEKSKPYTGDLKKSFENYLSWILSNKDENSAEFYSRESKIICMKNILTKLLKIPYGWNLTYKFYAVYLDGVTYLMNEKAENYANSEKISNWGHKFEQFLTYGENVENGVTSNLDYRCVLRSQIGSHKIFFSSSIDCVNPDLFEGTLTDLSSCVTFKCSYDNPNNEKKNLQRFKMCDWCTGIALNGIPNIIVGYRDKDGTVRRLKLYSQEDLEQEGKEFWNLNRSFTFLDKILSFVKERTRSKPEKIFSFVKPERNSYVKSEEVDMELFLPSWFTDEFKCYPI